MAPPPPPAGRHVVVVGGGLTGLVAAQRLASASSGAVRVTLLEAADRIGGKVETGRCGEWAVELGPDSFLARSGELQRLCAEVGLDDALIAPATARTAILHGGRLRWIPDGLVLGVPLQLRPLQRSHIVSAGSVVRAGLEPWVRRRPVGPDDPLGALVRRRLGRQVYERLVDPLVSGIYAGRADGMSVGAVAPQLLEALRSHGSLRRGLRRTAGAGRPGPAGPAFLTVGGGLSRLIERLGDALPQGALQTGCAATSLDRGPAGWVVGTDRGPLPPAAAVIVASPAFAAAPLVDRVNPGAAAGLRGIPYASVATVTLAYPAAALSSLPEARGFLVPRTEGLRITACTFLGRKWPHLAAADVHLLRASVGRHGDEAALALPDAQLAAEVHLELRRTLGVRSGPTAITVQRWPQALPQYLAGHLGRVDALDSALAATPGLFVAGAAIRGVGLAACAADGRRSADLALAAVGVL